MIDVACRPLPMFAPIAEGERYPDRLAELLQCMADLVIETGRQRVRLEEHQRGDDPRVQAALERLSQTERSLVQLGAEVASVHQLLQHVRMI